MELSVLLMLMRKKMKVFVCEDDILTMINSQSSIYDRCIQIIVSSKLNLS
jgi:hypothetical protein